MHYYSSVSIWRTVVQDRAAGCDCLRGPLPKREPLPRSVTGDKTKKKWEEKTRPSSVYRRRYITNLTRVVMQSKYYIRKTNVAQTVYRPHTHNIINIIIIQPASDFIIVSLALLLLLLLLGTIFFIYTDVMDIYSRVCCTHTQTSVL